MEVSRWLSLSIAIIYILFFSLSVIFGGDNEETTRDIVEEAFGIILWLVISVGCIWLGDELGEGMVGAKCGLVSSPSPGWAVKLIGWILLILPAGVIIWHFARGAE